MWMLPAGIGRQMPFSVRGRMPSGMLFTIGENYVIGVAYRRLFTWVCTSKRKQNCRPTFGSLTITGLLTSVNVYVMLVPTLCIGSSV